MKAIKVIIATIVIIVFVPFCQSQSKNLQYGSRLKPKVESKFDSLYPHASGSVTIYRGPHPSDTTQEVRINCHCDEAPAMMVLLFDTNGNLLNKEIHYTSMKGLPDTIVNYMKKNTSSHMGFYNDYLLKSINNKGEIGYGVMMWQSPGSWSMEQYILRF